MKKLFALMLAACLLCCGAAFAENAVTWDMVEPALAESGVAGQFYSLNQVAMMIWIPDGFAPVAAEELPDPFIAAFAAEDGSTITFTYVDAEGMDLEAYATKVAEAGGTGIEAGTVNGLPCITYELQKEDGSIYLCTSFTTESGYLLEVAAGPAQDENARMAISFVMASIQPEA